LPDGLFSYQKSQFGYILEGLGKENVGIFYDLLEYFTAIWCILWPLGTVCCHLVCEKRWQGEQEL
jgi:cyanate permease